jgi:hypothetical protein
MSNNTGIYNKVFLKLKYAKKAVKPPAPKEPAQQFNSLSPVFI